MMFSLVAGIIVLAQCATVLAQDPDITENILPDIKRIGVTGRLQCIVINQQDNPVNWIHRDTDTTISTDDKIMVDDKHNMIVNGWPKYLVERSYDGLKVIYTIVINRLEPRDAGNYTCQILVRGSTDHPSKDGEMVVLIPPSISQARTTHTAVVKVGDGLNLTCDATGYPRPNITWVRINGDILPDGQLKFMGTRMLIESIAVDDRGVYRCLADNNVRPPATHDATVMVHFSPVAAAVQDSYGQAANRMFDITIECRIAGLPEPDLMWYKEVSGGNRQPISNKDKHTVNILLNHANILEQNERWFQLVIRAVQHNDYGWYICEGRNNMGAGEARVYMFETSECQGPNCPVEQETARAVTSQRAPGTVVLGVAILCVLSVMRGHVSLLDRVIT